jgi:hypothetical protein
MKIGKLIPSTLAALVLCGPVAQASGEQLQPGPDPAAVDSSRSCRRGETTARIGIESSLGCKARAALRLSDHVSIEGIRESVDDFGTRTNLVEGADDAASDVRTDSITLNGKLVASLGRLRTYLSGGVGLLNAKGDVRVAGTHVDAGGLNFAGRLGGGLDLRATDRISLFVDTAYTMGTDAVGEARYFNLGWGGRYRF